MGGTTSAASEAAAEATPVVSKLASSETATASNSSDAACCPEATFDCDQCRVSFKTRNALFRHLRETPACRKNEKDIMDMKPKEPEVPKLEPFFKKDALEKKEKKHEGKKVKEYRKLNIETRPESYDAELAEKVKGVEDSFKAFGGETLPALETFASEPDHFRMKAEFDIYKADTEPCYKMFNGREPVTITHYPMAARSICEGLMPKLLEGLKGEEVLKAKLFQANFHTTLHGDALVSLLYHSPYARAERKVRETQRQAGEDAPEPEGPCQAPEWIAAATRLQAVLGGVSIVGHSRGKKSVVGRDWVEERLQVPGIAKPLKYRQLEGFFSQSNGTVAQHMLGWAFAVARSADAVVGVPGAARDDDLLELYCGNGNFSVALAPCFRRVLATELVKALLEAGKVNAEANGVSNIAFARVSAEELGQAMDGARSFTRLEHVDFSTYNLRTVLVDPPRVGLGAEVATSLSKFPRIVYISCNPVTLRADLEVLHKTHAIRRLAAFDQFPYTEHLEMGVLLERRVD